MTYLKIMNIFYIQTLVNLPTPSLAFQRQVMMKLKVMDALHKTDLHSKITICRRNTGLKQSESSPQSSPRAKDSRVLRECEHKEALARVVELVLQKQTELQLCF